MTTLFDFGSAELLDRFLAEGTVYRVDLSESSRRIVIQTTNLDPSDVVGEVVRRTTAIGLG